MQDRFVRFVTFFLAFIVVSGCSSDTPPTSDLPVQVADSIEQADGQLAVAPNKNEAAEAPPDNPNPDLSQYALIIACSKYDFLEGADLVGTANDVPLMRNLLLTKFNFAKQNVTVLDEKSGKTSHRPLFKNIQREFQALAKRVKSGDRVVVLFSGHGSQIPDNDPDNPEDPEPDGLDEILCPADLKPEFDLKTSSLPNAIRDDDMGEWLMAIRKKGASVWVIIDACHSGSAVRGTQVTRQIRPETLVPEDALRAARDRAPKTRGANDNTSSFEIRAATDLDQSQITAETPKLGGLAAIYAAQPHEPTIELPMPHDEFGAPMQGLLTYTLVKTLTQSTGKLTYTELVRRIHDQYVYDLGLSGPKPLVEGSDRHKEVLGRKEWPERSRFVLENRAGSYHINAGQLHGVTKGAVFAVFAPLDARQPDKPTGYVRVSKGALTDSTVVPCKFEQTPRNDALLNSSRCELVQIDYGSFRLKVALDGSDDSLGLQLKKMSEAEGSLVELVADPKQAEWLIRPVEKKQLLLVPAAGWFEPLDAENSSFGPVPNDEKAIEWLEQRLVRIARAKSLLRISGASRAQRQRGWLTDLLKGNATTVKVELLRLKDEGDAEGEPIKSDKAKIELKAGDLIAIRVTNRSRHAIDFSLLFVDSGFGIDPIFPAPGRVVDNRLNPNKSFTVGPMEIEGNSFGLEHVVVIALKAEGQPVEFSWLAQDSIERIHNARSAGVEGPLDQLFQQAMFGRTSTRGLKVVEAESAYLNVLSWQTVRPE